MPRSIELSEEQAKFANAVAAKAIVTEPGGMIRVGSPFDPAVTRNILHGAGLHRVRAWRNPDPQEGLNYFEAYSPDPSPVQGVVAIMSLPRYGACANFGFVTKALLPLKIDLEQGFGVYWSEVMTQMMSVLASRNVKYILAIDFDSVFDSEDVRLLYQLMEKTSDAGAICGVQMRRTKPTALVTMKDGAAKVPLEVFEQELTEVRSAHFGLTMIRTAALCELSKPWFAAKPDDDGEWKPEKGYVAADVAFWIKFAEEGHKLMQANYVAVGHGFEGICWPGRDLTPVIQNMDDFRETGIPDEALR